MKDKLSGFCLFPQTAGVSNSGHPIIGGCNTVELAATFGNPLSIFNETTLHKKCLENLHKFSKCYPYTQIIYTCRALIRPVWSLFFKREGSGLEVVSDEEISIAGMLPFPQRESTSITIMRAGKHSKL